MSNNPTLNLLNDIIQHKNLSRLIGLKENCYFEIKNKHPYDLNSPNDRYELSKDVSAFANTEGGYIVIGLKHKPVENEFTEEVEALDLIKKDEFIINQYEGILRDSIYPNPSGLKIDWVEDLSNSELGIGYIFIPPQSPNKKFFLMKNIIENNEKIKNIVFGIVQRNGASSTPLTEQQLYQKIQYGIASVPERLKMIEEKIDILINNPQIPSSHKSSLEILEDRVTGIKFFG